jgi:polyvinyl alcohol dehydrogenase (cytochrome)
MFGQNPANTASNAAETGISTSTAPRLKTKWTFLTGGDVSARAAVVKGVVYFPDWGGNLWALNASTGEVIWSHQISDYGLAMGTVSRTSPTVANGILYIGTRYVAPATAATPQPPTGWLLAIDAASGNLWWKMQPDTSNPFPVITGSPVVARGMVFVPMTSNEEYAAANPAYPCCSASGSVVAVDALFRPSFYGKRSPFPRATAAAACGAVTLLWTWTAERCSSEPETTTAFRPNYAQLA